MKMKIGLIAGVLVFGATFYLSVTPTNSENVGLSLSNIEALSLGETDKYCLGIGSVDCPVRAVKVQNIIYY